MRKTVTTRRFGPKVRALRKKKGMGLRELGRHAHISPTFLFNIEAGNQRPPKERKIRALAKALGCEEEVLLALSGELPTDVIKVVQEHPCEYFALLRASKGLSAEQLREVQGQLGHKGKL
jgi:hypothetical protein